MTLRIQKDNIFKECKFSFSNARQNLDRSNLDKMFGILLLFIGMLFFLLFTVLMAVLPPATEDDSDVETTTEEYDKYDRRRRLNDSRHDLEYSRYTNI